MTKTHSLRQTLFRLMAIPAIGILLILAGIILLATFLLRNEVVARQRVTIEALALQGNQFLSESELILTTLARTIPELPLEQQENLLRQARLNNPRFTFLSILDENGVVQANSSGRPDLVGLDYSNDAVFKEARTFRRICFSAPFLSVASGSVAVNAAAPIEVNGKFAGVLVAELNLYLLQETIVISHQPGDAISFIVDQHGTLVAYPDPQWVQERRNLGDLPVVQEGYNELVTYVVFFDEEQGSWLVGSAMPMRSNWVVVSLQPFSSAALPFGYLIGAAALVFLLTLVTFVLIQIYILRRITRPISALVEKTHAVANGTYQALEEEQSDQFAEVLSLTQSFQYMAEAVQERDRLLEQKVASRTAQLQAANKELETFSYSVSHDLRAPLRRIDGYTHMLSDSLSGRLGVEDGHFLERIRVNCQQMNQLIESLLSLSRLTRTALVLGRVDLGALAQIILDDLRQAEPERKVETCVAPDLLVTADVRMMRAVLDNLLGNAWKFTGRCALARITVGKRVQPGGETVYFVRDNGVGFDMQYCERLFGAFQRLHTAEEYPGDGIGLATVQRIIHRHGGRVWAEGQPGEGATFYFTLPETPHD